MKSCDSRNAPSAGACPKRFARMKKHIALLTAIQSLNKRQTKALLQLTNDDDFCRAICEVCLNLVKGNVPLTKRQKAEFTPKRKKLVRSLAQKKLSRKARKQLVVQTGGFLPALIAPVISILGGLLGEVIGKKL